MEAHIALANAEGYMVEIGIGDGEFLEINLEVLLGLAALPFYGSPLPAGFFAAPPPALPAANVAVPAIQHGFGHLDEVQLGFAALPFYGAELPHDFLLPNENPWKELAVALKELANAEGYDVELGTGVVQYRERDLDVILGLVALPFYGSPLPSADDLEDDLPHDFLLPNDENKSGIAVNPWKEVCSRKLVRNP